MKNPFARQLRYAGLKYLPAGLMRRQLAARNRRRGEAELGLLPEFVPRDRAAVDVGAYLGVYTDVLLGLAGFVHVFEPQPFCCDFLRRAYGERIGVHECALSDVDGEGLLAGGFGAADAGPATQTATLATGPGQSAAVGYRVQRRRLDSFHLDDVGFIKIDAEGHELEILNGAADTIAAERPTLLVEIEQRHSATPIEDTFAWLEARDYAGSYWHNGRLHALSTFSVTDLQAARLSGDKSRPYINNFFFRPR